MNRLTGLGWEIRNVSEDPFWRLFPDPPYYTSILIKDDGTVTPPAGEMASFTLAQINAPDTLLFIQGGTQWFCEGTGFIHDALLAAGYGCEPIPETGYQAIYADEYQD